MSAWRLKCKRCGRFLIVVRQLETDGVFWLDVRCECLPDLAAVRLRLEVAS